VIRALAFNIGRTPEDARLSRLVQVIHRGQRASEGRRDFLLAGDFAAINLLERSLEIGTLFVGKSISLLPMRSRSLT
jgi:hypothetical protein